MQVLHDKKLLDVRLAPRVVLRVLASSARSPTGMREIWLMTLLSRAAVSSAAKDVARCGVPPVRRMLMLIATLRIFRFWVLMESCLGTVSECSR